MRGARVGSMLTRRKVMMNICGDQSLCVPREIGAEFERNYAHDRCNTVIGTKIVTTFLQLGPWNVADKKLELFGGFSPSLSGSFAAQESRVESNLSTLGAKKWCQKTRKKGEKAAGGSKRSRKYRVGNIFLSLGYHFFPDSLSP